MSRGPIYPEPDEVKPTPDAVKAFHEALKPKEYWYICNVFCMNRGTWKPGSVWLRFDPIEVKRKEQTK